MKAFRSTTPLLFVAKELKEKLLFEREKRRLSRVPQVQVTTEFGQEVPETPELTDDAIAVSAGLMSSTNTVNLNEAVDSKIALSAMIAEQRAKLNANKDAFMEWQAGQREKGSAVRLHRQGLKAERYKRSYSVTAGARIMSVSYHSELGDNTNNDFNTITRERLIPRRDLAKVNGLITTVRRR